MAASTAPADIAGILERSSRILVMTHISPDGDAIGSLLGFGWLLREQGKNVTLVEVDPIPAELRCLPGVDTIVTDSPTGPWDAVVALDASDTARLGPAFRPAEYAGTPVITLDHHVTNLNFGTFNWVDPTAAATAQVVVHLADTWGKPISQAAAECLLAGLVTDTRGFRTSNVTAGVMATAMRLMESGANLAQITERVLNYKPFGIIRLWGPALSQARLEGRVVWTHVTQAMRAEVDAPQDGEGGLVSFLLEAPEADVSAVFSETQDGDIEIGLRSKPGFDISGVALSLGGGGHAQASGCTVEGPLAAAEARVLPLLQEVTRSAS